MPDVAAAEPALLDDRLGGVFRLVQVAHHPLRRPEPELPRLARGDILAGGRVHHSHLGAGQQRARRDEPVRPCGVPVGLRGQGTDHAGQLGLTVDLDEVEPGPGRERLAQHRQRHRGGPVEQVLQPAQRGDRLLARGEQGGYHRGHQEGVGGPGGERRQQRRRVRLAGERARRPGVDAEQRIAGAADVEQRHRDQVAVTLPQRRHRDRVAGVLDDVAVRQHHALRPPGRAGAVHHQPQIFPGHVAAPVGGPGGGQERLIAVVRAAHRDHVGDPGILSRMASTAGSSSAPANSTLAPESLIT